MILAARPRDVSPSTITPTSAVLVEDFDEATSVDMDNYKLSKTHSNLKDESDLGTEKDEDLSETTLLSKHDLFISSILVNEDEVDLISSTTAMALPIRSTSFLTVSGELRELSLCNVRNENYSQNDEAEGNNKRKEQLIDDRCVNNRYYENETIQSGNYPGELMVPIENETQSLGDTLPMCDMPDIYHKQRSSAFVDKLPSKDVQVGRTVEPGDSNNKSMCDSHQSPIITCEMGSNGRDKNGYSGDDEDDVAKKNENVFNKHLVYGVDDVPPLYLSMLLGIQVSVPLNKNSKINNMN